MFDFFLKAIILLLGAVWCIVWIITGTNAETAKPKQQPATAVGNIKRAIFYVFVVIVLLQIFGVSLYQFDGKADEQIFGLVLFIMSLALSFWARFTIGTNWAHAADYQIKKGHELVTTGPYAYIRHPIYLSLLVAVVGVELVLHSYLIIPFTVCGCIGGYYQALQEEKILEEYFGVKYKAYQERTKLFILGLI